MAAPPATTVAAGLEEMTISFLREESAAVDDEGSGEQGQRHQDPPNDELPLPPSPPAGAENHDFDIVWTVVWTTP